MQFRDTLGQTIDKDDAVLVPTGFGMMQVGKVIAASSGLDPQNPTPILQVALVLTVGCEANGVVAGIIKVPKEN